VNVQVAAAVVYR